MPSKKILTPIVSGASYHIFNRGVNRTPAFLNTSDYLFFLDLFKEYISPVADLFAYALLPNHYHFLLRIREDIEATDFSIQFKRLVLRYTYWFNKRENRSGNLFLKTFKRLRAN